jgi:hypothetical protein
MNESTGVIVEEKELRQEPAGWLAVCCGRMELSVGSGKQALKEDATDLVAAGFAARAIAVLCGLGAKLFPVVLTVGESAEQCWVGVPCEGSFSECAGVLVEMTRRKWSQGLFEERIMVKKRRRVVVGE